MYCNTISEVQKVVAALLFTNESHITLNFVDVQMQRGSQDSGLFAIAFATALCLGKKPGQLCFDQDRMHTHLLKCIESQEGGDHITNMGPISLGIWGLVGGPISPMRGGGSY